MYNQTSDIYSIWIDMLCHVAYSSKPRGDFSNNYVSFVFSSKQVLDPPKNSWTADLKFWIPFKTKLLHCLVYFIRKQHMHIDPYKTSIMID